MTVFESNVILSYLEDKYKEAGPSLEPATAEGRQAMQLLCRVHDLYIASPNCTAPGFSHSQGAMYLSNGWHGPARGMDLPTRAAKLGEIWKQLSWLEAQVQKEARGGPHLLGVWPIRTCRSPAVAPPAAAARATHRQIPRGRPRCRQTTA